MFSCHKYFIVRKASTKPKIMCHYVNEASIVGIEGAIVQIQINLSPLANITRMPNVK